MRRVLLGVLMVLMAGPVRAAEPVRVTMAGIGADGVLRLTDGGQAVLSCLRPAADAGPDIQRRVAGQALAFRDAGRDRYGRLTGQVFLADGSWLQQDLARGGLALVWCFAGERASMPALLAAEAEARAARRGLWADAARMPAPADARGLGGFALVEDYVLGVSAGKGDAFLDFGRDWRRDFSVKIPRAVAAQMKRAGTAPADLAGRRLRVRGWIVWRNGPMIDITHPEQIELVD